MAVAQTRLAEDLFAEHSRRIYAYCLRRLRSPEEAEDAVQVTYLNACRSLKRGFRPDVAEAWLLKVAHNVCITRLRSSSRRARLEWPRDVGELEEVVPAPSGAGDELFGLENALATLPEQQRRAILLREWQGLSYREVAEELGLSQSAVEALLFRARRSLAAALEAPEAPAPRRLAVHSFGLGGFLASLKTTLAGGLGVKVGTGAAVAVTAATLAVVPLSGSAVPEREAKAPRLAAAVEHRAVAPPERRVAPTRSAVYSPAPAAIAGPRGTKNGKGLKKAEAARGRREARGNGPPAHAKAYGQGGSGGGNPGKGPKKP
jgi:RNA polymerase sigma factor (sigma-70 family)